MKSLKPSLDATRMQAYPMQTFAGVPALQFVGEPDVAALGGGIGDGRVVWRVLKVVVVELDRTVAVDQ